MIIESLKHEDYRYSLTLHITRVYPQNGSLYANIKLPNNRKLGVSPSIVLPVLLDQALRSSRTDNYCYIPTCSIHEQTGLTRHAIDEAIKRLEKAGILSYTVHKAASKSGRGAPTRHFTFHIDTLNKLCVEAGYLRDTKVRLYNIQDEPPTTVKQCVELINRRCQKNITLTPEQLERIREMVPTLSKSTKGNDLCSEYQVVSSFLRKGHKATLHYHTTDKSSRVFLSGQSYQNVPREIRKVALQGDISLDLKCCHMAAAAKVWGCELLSTYLENTNIWSQLKRIVGTEDKEQLKSLMYAIIYGKSEGGVFAQIQEITGCPTKAKQVFSHQLFRDILKARKRYFTQLKAERSYVDAWGRTISFTLSNQGEDLQEQLASKLSQQLQSFELRALVAALQVPDLAPKLWLHDGIYISRDQKHLVEEAADAINAECRKMGLPTYVEIEEVH